MSIQNDLPTLVRDTVLDRLGLKRSFFHRSDEDYDYFREFTKNFLYELRGDGERGLYNNFADGGDLWGESVLYWKTQDCIIGEVVCVHEEVRYLAFTQNALKIIEDYTEVMIAQARHKFGTLGDASIIMIGDFDDY